MLISLIANAVVTSLLPATGPNGGFTEVTVTGSNFLAAHFTCKFDRNVTRGTVDSASVARCVSPAHATGSVDVEVSNNNQDYTANTVHFTYQGIVLFGCVCLCVCSSVCA